MDTVINHHNLDIEFIQYCELVFFYNAFESDLTKVVDLELDCLM